MKTEISPIAMKVLGYYGKKISQSKTLGPATAVWNSKIADVNEIIVWTGDIDIERHREQLLQLAKELGPLYILPERGESKHAALVIIDQDKIWIDDNFAKYIHNKSMRAILKGRNTKVARDRDRI
jgi:hypothetical protein